MDCDNPYITLGLEESATLEEITAKYRSLARKHHPDKNPNDPGAKERMQKINAARAQLRTPEGIAAVRKRLEEQRERQRRAKEEGERQQREAEERERQRRAKEEGERQQREAEERERQRRAKKEELVRDMQAAAVSLAKPSATTPTPQPQPGWGGALVAGLFILGGIALAANQSSGPRGPTSTRSRTRKHWDPNAERYRDNKTGRFTSD